MPGSYASGAAASKKRSRWGRLFGAHDELEDVILAASIEDPDAKKDGLMDCDLDEERDVTSRIEDDIDQNPTSSPAARSLLPSTYLHRDSFEFAVDDDRSDKEEEVDFYDNEPDKSHLRIPWKSLRTKASSALFLPKSTRRTGGRI
ncbi:hypothetical protein F5887DRAFT_1082573 [Amanita rubescens]|nr:hypothetical protein F5887DRAFT_1082573 [Amanita rubescens]